MKCPFCGYEETKVLDSRPVSNGTSIRRRRECLQCQARFTTYERYEQTRIRIIKKDGRRELYDRKKLMNGILKACEKRPVSTDQIEEIVDNIEEQLRRSGNSEIYSSEIGDKVMEQLKSIDQVAYVRFASVYKEFRDLDSFLQAIRELKNS
ncbi:NrdR family transcriptional regulator [Petrotoga mexicana DSM 14811]|jgi:transcriptional repressor NrdR|uniref:Transcriptional repressor NrdR n=2 Tax=Petrotoga TaxID=28236 RepID=NRDR_PETMO|nr:MULTISPECIES: transcriptional regulator NrdR [Petrotoga]A9BFB9.1 RecName: Full=Transcriptional repressor NrdR [Petrotoga mobilis SJ95]MDK2812476.1 transcriptional repressor NrdR [Petrotoga sp.]ABX30904.1 ATP-cone domain protein [Petrotoga mobilis SJ95]MBL5981203.1 NrdR family transcriptional regulator [Petrotoga sp. 8T1HF07.NaAc.6.1]MDK2906392.1 transcriptional repressor NrdR [Petrotoga sp.]PNR88621.1 NrdR family transcriptional regulator [Petrotoga sp. 9T1HF07.CasAA.8.2]